MDALVADGLTKAYGDTRALSGVSFSVPSGEVFALVGPNGAGKTTIVRCLTGTTQPDAGTVTILEATPTTVDNARVGLLPQEFSPPERLTARELITYYGGLYRSAKPTTAVLTAVGLTDTADTRYANLSGGQRRRVCVGAALVNDPDVLFLDEPTTGIDPAGRRATWDLIEEQAAGGTTVFLTTHYMEEAAKLADRVGILRGGELVTVDPPAAIVAAHGGTSRLRIVTDDTVDLPGYRVEPVEDGIVVHGVSPPAIADVITVLEAEEVEFEALSWHEPDLETAYLSLTGEPIPEPERERR